MYRAHVIIVVCLFGYTTFLEFTRDYSCYIPGIGKHIHYVFDV